MRDLGRPERPAGADIPPQTRFACDFGPIAPEFGHSLRSGAPSGIIEDQVLELSTAPIGIPENR